MGNINVKILVLGLDNSGKSAVVNYLASKGTATSTVEPTTGYTLQDIKYSGGVTFTCWDVAGRENLRGLWKHYFDKTDALVWVIDSADKKRFDESVEWLRRVINEPDMQNCVILVLANKQDLPDAASKVTHHVFLKYE
jgi:small GTP-binding protein